MVTLVVSQATTVLSVVVSRTGYVQAARQLTLERLPRDYPRDT